MKALVFVVLVVLAGCSVTPDEYKRAEELCSSHKGIKYLYGTLTTGVDVMCNDKTRITESNKQ